MNFEQSIASKTGDAAHKTNLCALKTRFSTLNEQSVNLFIFLKRLKRSTNSDEKSAVSEIYEDVEEKKN